MNRPWKGFLLFMVWVMAGPICAQANTNAADRARSAFQQLEGRFDTVQTLGYTATRVSKTRQRTLEDKWTFVFRKPADFKLHYQRPEERLLTANQTTLWEYLPSAAKARQTDLSEMTSQQRDQLLTPILSRVSLEGIRVGNSDDMILRTVSVTDEPGAPGVITILGQSPKFIARIDTNRNVLLNVEVYDMKNELVLRTTASRFLEVLPAFWYPQEIEIVYRNSPGYISSHITLGDIRINTPVNDNTFLFIPPKQVEVIRQGNDTKKN